MTSLLRYENVIVFDPGLEEDAVKAQLAKVAAIIQAHGGAIENEQIWGRRRLSYRINKQEFGQYTLLVFNGDNALVADLDRQLRINESVLRHLIVVKDKHAPDSVPRFADEADGFGMGAGGDDMDFGGDIEEASN